MATPILGWLPHGEGGLMMRRVSPLGRVLAGVVAACVAASLGVPTARAQAADDGWFDDGTGNQPAPSAPAAPGTPQAPAAPGRPAEPTSLAPSPLLSRDGAPASDVEDQDPRALSAWNSYVDPYGVWVDDPRYGRVWIPNSGVVGSDFAPYSTGGHWALDENEDWVWVSDYPFGWVTFHYGRWVWIAGRGWAWIPGLRYAPAWVTWRVPYGSYAYVGWAPMPPAYLWFGGGAIVFGYAPLYPWVFCPSEYVFSTRVHYYIVHDHYTMNYAARYTRPYYAAPRGGGYVAAPRGPSPQAARVPSRAVPSERVSSRAIATRGTVASGMRNAQGRDFATRGTGSRSLGTTPFERTRAPGRQPAPQRSELLRPDARSRSELTPRRDAPAWNGPRDRDISPRRDPSPRPAPHLEPRRESPRLAPVERMRSEPRQVTPHFDRGGNAPSRMAPSFGGGRTGGGRSGGGGHRR